MILLRQHFKQFSLQVRFYLVFLLNTLCVDEELSRSNEHCSSSLKLARLEHLQDVCELKRSIFSCIVWNLSWLNLNSKVCALLMNKQTTCSVFTGIFGIQPQTIVLGLLGGHQQLVPELLYSWIYESSYKHKEENLETHNWMWNSYYWGVCMRLAQNATIWSLSASSSASVLYEVVFWWW